ncbi:MAG: putative DNA-binding domain-containing protein [Cocleimonas sp.]|nr:putative DNA-binding domain-containing protein [Cocleimonas sp.]
MSLDKLQQDVVKAFFGDPIVADDYIIGDDVLTAAQRFGIYKGSVHGVLTQALSDMYPVCKALVGDSFFDHVTSKFINKNPPDTAFFADFGGGFSHFLSHFESAKSVEYLADMAYLEWLRHNAWNSKNQSASDFSTLETYSVTQQMAMVFSLAETASLWQSEYRIDQLWDAHQEESAIDLAQIDIFEHLKLLIWRNDYTLHMHKLTAQQFSFLNAVQQGKPLEILAEEFTETLPELLSISLQNAWIRSYEIPISK